MVCRWAAGSQKVEMRVTPDRIQHVWPTTNRRARHAYALPEKKGSVTQCLKRKSWLAFVCDAHDVRLCTKTKRLPWTNMDGLQRSVASFVISEIGFAFPGDVVAMGSCRHALVSQ
jgi:hypothetical protein